MDSYLHKSSRFYQLNWMSLWTSALNLASLIERLIWLFYKLQGWVWTLNRNFLEIILEMCTLYNPPWINPRWKLKYKHLPIYTSVLNVNICVIDLGFDFISWNNNKVYVIFSDCFAIMTKQNVGFQAKQDQSNSAAKSAQNETIIISRSLIQN